ncbi:tectonin beta-propeller repeat-containing protein 2 isoform X2 [Anabrus simplex]|uniref:tectonin beta-propeller repeat-containing protein 2 isoform X2 n=1 Tax=Anabrus simplex TaxID=316456 RepID=UPI0035A2FC61
MADPSSEEEASLREWSPLTAFLQQVPLKAQRGIFTYDLNLTCVDALPDFIAVGTNMGLVYWYNRKKGDLQRLRCENTASSVSCVKVISTVDYMVAAGNELGIVTVFQIPKAVPDCLPESMKPKKNKQVERYTISGLHTAPVTAIEWSLNGMKLFSGDKNGMVVLTEIDFYMHLSKSIELLNEKYEIVQLSYCQQQLLVSTLYRSIVCHRDDRWRVAQVGQKERKSLGKLGATFCYGSGRPQELVIYASRPGLRLWLADKNGIVQQTLIYKDTMLQAHTHVPLINPAPAHVKQGRGEHQFGPLLVFKENLLLTYSSDVVYILNPSDISVVAMIVDLRKVLDVSVSKDEIFVLEGNRSLIRIASVPENGTSQVSGSKLEQHQPDGPFMSIPVSLSDMSVASSLRGLTSKFKDTAIPFHLFSQESIEEQCTWNPVVTADEAVELPPIVALPVEDLTGLTVEKGTFDENKVYKEVYNRSQWSSINSRRGSSVSRDSSRAELLEKIGEQQFEEVVFKPKHKRKKKKRTASKPKHLVSGTESGSDTMSTNSVRSNASDCEDPWSSERLDVSSDWSSVSTRPGSSTNNDRPALRSSSEETLVRLGESMISEIGTLPSDNRSDIESQSVVEQDNRPDDLKLNVEGFIPPCIQPDLRSPATIERDVATKEKLLAEVLNLDTLCIDKNEAKEHDVNKVPVSLENLTKPNGMLTLGCCVTAELTHAVIVEDKRTEECETVGLVNEDRYELSESATYVAEDEKLASFNSSLSYGPPSGSSAPPSNHASLEISHPVDGDFDKSNFQTSDRSDCWVQYCTPDDMVSFAVCRHYVCCIDSRDILHYSGVNGLGLKWQKADDRAEQIALSINGMLVWKLQKGIAYSLVNPSQKGPFGEKWVEAAKYVQSIAVDDNIAWYVTLESQIHVQKFLTADKPCSTPIPVLCVYPATRICCFQGMVWVLTSNSKVLYRAGISPIVPEGKEWKEVAVPFPVIDIALGCHGTGWVVETKNVIHFTKNVTAETPQWWQVLISDCIFQPISTSLQHLCSKLTDNYLKNLRHSSTNIIAAGEDSLWISEKMADKVHMNKTKFTGHQWNRVLLKNLRPNYKWQKISAEGMCKDKGYLWMLAEAGDLFFLSPATGNFHGVPLPDSSNILSLAATPQAVWLLFANGQIFVCQTGKITVDSSWKSINLTQLGTIRFIHLSCSSDSVWACSDQGEVYMTIGSPRSMASSTFAPAWIPVDEKPDIKTSFTKVYVGSQTFMVWALDKKRHIYVRTDIQPDFPLGRGWSLVSGIEAIELSISIHE